MSASCRGALLASTTSPGSHSCASRSKGRGSVFTRNRSGCSQSRPSQKGCSLMSWKPPFRLPSRFDSDFCSSCEMSSSACGGSVSG